jgi:hypothetical protein
MEKNEVQSNRVMLYSNYDKIIPRVVVLSDKGPRYKVNKVEGMCEDLRVLKDMLSTKQTG